MTKHTFTIFCKDLLDANGTTWISAVEAETPDEAAKLGRNQCADEWGYAGDDVLVVGVAQGDIDIIGWDDDGNCLAETPRMNKFWAPPAA